MTLERWRPSWGLMPWRPLREMEELERRFENMFGRSLMPALWRRVQGEGRAWSPALEVLEKEDRYVVKAELPGAKQEDIEVSVVGDTLTIKGEKKAETEVNEEDYHLRECSYGSFYRSIGLPPNVNPQKIEASFDDGVLEVTVPKAAEVKAKKVSVSAKKKEKAKAPTTKTTSASKTTRPKKTAGAKKTGTASK